MIRNLDFYSKHFLKIVTKKSELSPLIFNEYQRDLNKLISDVTKPIRIIVLKSRQIGISTFCAAHSFHRAATNYYTRSLIIANDLDSTNNIFNMAKRFYDFLPPQVRPQRRASNAKEIVFDTPKGNPVRGLISSIVLETAGNAQAGRSTTNQCIHLSEFAFWANASTVVTGLFQSIPNIKGTSVIIESTANGYGGEFYERWKAAESGQSEFIPVFFPAHLCEDYRMPLPEGFKLTKEEADIKKRIPKVTDEFLVWRRYKIANEMGSALLLPEDQFRQEYCLTPDEAFITSGRPVFPIDDLLSMISNVESVKFKRGDI